MFIVISRKEREIAEGEAIGGDPHVHDDVEHRVNKKRRDERVRMHGTDDHDAKHQKRKACEIFEGMEEKTVDCRRRLGPMMDGVHAFEPPPAMEGIAVHEIVEKIVKNEDAEAFERGPP